MTSHQYSDSNVNIGWSHDRLKLTSGIPTPGKTFFMFRPRSGAYIVWWCFMSYGLVLDVHITLFVSPTSAVMLAAIGDMRYMYKLCISSYSRTSIKTCTWIYLQTKISFHIQNDHYAWSNIDMLSNIQTRMNNRDVLHGMYRLNYHCMV